MTLIREPGSEVDAFFDDDGFGVRFVGVDGFVLGDRYRGSEMCINRLVGEKMFVGGVYLSVNSGDKEVSVSLTGSSGSSCLRVNDMEMVLSDDDVDKEIVYTHFKEGDIVSVNYTNKTVGLMNSRCECGLIYCGEQLEDRG